jgi:hypothetical protein
MTKEACAYENDVLMMVAEDYSIAHCVWISFRGSVKIELDEISWVGRPKGGATERGGKRREGERVMRWNRLPMLKDWEFGGSVEKFFVGALLKVEIFHDIAVTLIPAVFPWEGDISKNTSIPFLPSLEKDESWK